ncbi:MAG: hypothetical protein M1818_005329 [Claussenomyces sp. TS43310]|nr:MAG: hypothetical protein M1818_005329 [Claussenomyces sp. TS43310]
MSNKRLKRGHLEGLQEIQADVPIGDYYREYHSESASVPENDHDAIPAEASELHDIRVCEVLEQDSRPTFILDLLDRSANRKTLNVIFCNSSLKSFEILLDVVSGVESPEALGSAEKLPYEAFRGWATSVTTFDQSRDIFPLSYLYCDMLWTGSTIRKKWRVISGNHCYKVANFSCGDLSSGKASTATLEDQPAASQLSHAFIPPPSDKPHEKISQTSLHDRPDPDNKEQSPSMTKPHAWRGSDVQELSNDGGSSGGTHTEHTMSVVSSVQARVPDWTILKPKGQLSQYLELCRSIDWSTTSLGSMDAWTPEFRQIANLMMADAHPVTLIWGDEYTMLYNESFATCAVGIKYPELLGKPYREAFWKVWESIPTMPDVFSETRRTGKSLMIRDQELPIARYGFLEETFFSWSLAPVYGRCQTILGLWCAPLETTKQVIHERRMHLLRNLGDGTALARTVNEFWKKALDKLKEEHFDVPVALLYSVSDDSGDSDSSSHSSTAASAISQKVCVFEGSLGIPQGHPAAPARLDLRHGTGGFAMFFRDATRTLEPTRLCMEDGTLPESLLEGIKWRGFKEPCRDIIILPVRPTTSDNVLGFLLIGINPRRPYDDDYRSFINMLNRQLATSLASIILFQDDQKAAALERHKLSMQLEMQMDRMQRMTELAPVGMFYIDPDGLLLQANDRWYEITGHARETPYHMSWMEVVAPDSIPAVTVGWHILTVDQQPWSGELRLKRHWVDPKDETSIEFWVLWMAQPEFAPDGTLVSIMGSIADISQIKWAQGLQARRLDEAEETRRRQNNFIDITSHEMRNPLSAILQCAEDISTSVRQYLFERSATLPIDVANNCIESAETITLCAQHQKGIVDDILTISKLDSDLLVITPIVVQPAVVIRRAVKMFQAELRKKDIKMHFDVQKSYDELAVEWVALDPSRVLQVFINLMTNAIKFTQSEVNRSVIIRIGASLAPPSNENANFEYIPPKSPKLDSTLFGMEEWGNGEPLHLCFEVQDTGRGLSNNEKKLLFQRFSQASPRTHAQYGGSGLGLFISRQLTELHGGQIGVSSVAGIGSTFAFYVKAKRSDAQHSSDTILDSTLDPYLRRESSAAQASTGKEGSGSTEPSTSPLRAPRTASQVHPQDMHILIVEDNLVNQRVLCKQLQKIGCTVDVACHGEEALAHLEKTAFWEGKHETGEELSVILMDLEMPVMDGLTCVKEIRSLEAVGKLTGHIPVVAVTANVRSEQLTIAKEAGMASIPSFRATLSDDVLSKPFRIPDLIVQVCRLLSRQFA